MSGMGLDDRGSRSFDAQNIPVNMRDVFVQNPKGHWINPISMSALQKAVKAHKPTVVMNGIEFNITYDIYIDLPASGERREVVKLKRADGDYVPFGYIAMKTIERFHFEEEMK